MAKIESQRMEKSALWRRPIVARILFVLILAGAILVVYGRAIHAPFIYDDPACIRDNPSITRLWPLVGDEQTPGPLNPPKDLPTSGRPLVNLSLAANYYFGQLEPAGYHAFNLVTHFLVAVLLGLIVRRVLRLERFGERVAEASGWLAFLTAMLWALHPLNSEAVLYVTQRTELMVGLFYLASIYGSLRYWEAESNSRRKSWLIFTTLACIAGMACKEVMVTAPVAVLLIERTLVRGSVREALRRSWQLYLGLALGWLFLVGLNIGAPRSSSAGFHLNVSAVTWWMTQAKVIWIYLKLVVWPWPLSIHYAMPYLETIGQAWPWLLATILLAAAILVLLWQRRAAGLVGALALLVLSPTLVVPIVTEVAAERRMYLPLAAITTLIVAGSYWLLQRAARRTSGTRKKKNDAPMDQRQWESAALIAVAGVLVLAVWVKLDVERMDVFANPIALWQDAAMHEPNDYVVHNNLGGLLLADRRVRDAVSELEKSLQLEPKQTGAHINLGTALLRMGRTQEAADQFQRVVALHPEFLPGRCNLGIALGKMGRIEEAKEQFQEALKLEPKSPAVHYDLAQMLKDAGEMPKAMEELQKALELDPKYFEARFNYATALATSGRAKEALEQFEEALKLKPEECGVYFNIALTYDQLGQTQEAIAAGRKALALAREQQQTAAKEGKPYDAAMEQRISSWLQSQTAAPPNLPGPNGFPIN